MTGLTSVTFRHLSPSEIIRLAQKANMDGIEWGGDIHVPAGDKPTAKIVKEQTMHAGLQVFSYGSYYRLSENARWRALLWFVFGQANLALLKPLRICGKSCCIIFAKAARWPRITV